MVIVFFMYIPNTPVECHGHSALVSRNRPRLEAAARGPGRPHRARRTLARGRGRMALLGTRVRSTWHLGRVSASSVGRPLPQWNHPQPPTVLTAGGADGAAVGRQLWKTKKSPIFLCSLVLLARARLRTARRRFTSSSRSPAPRSLCLRKPRSESGSANGSWTSSGAWRREATLCHAPRRW